MKREDLLKAIEYIMPGIDKTNSPLGMDFLVFDKGYLRSFNDVVSVSFHIDDLSKEYQCAIKAQELYKILSRMEGDQVRLSLTPTELTVKNPKTTLKMSLMEKKPLETLMERLASLSTGKLKWNPLPSDFMEGLDLCAPSAKVNPTLGILAGIAMTKRRIMATDNQRISLYMMKEELPEEFLLPVEVIRDVIKYGSEAKSISIMDNWVHFSDKKGLILSTRRLMGEYPVDRVLTILKENSPGSSTQPYRLPEGLEKALDRAEVLAETEEEYKIPIVSLRRKEKFLILQGQQNIGRVEDKLIWEEKIMPEDLEIKISPDFLKKILRITREFKVSPNRNCILFGTKNFQHLMVVKIGG